MDDGRLSTLGLGLTNLVAQPHRRAGRSDSLGIWGRRQQLVRKVRRYHSACRRTAGMTPSGTFFHMNRSGQHHARPADGDAHEATRAAPESERTERRVFYQSMLEAFHVPQPSAPRQGHRKAAPPSDTLAQPLISVPFAVHSANATRNRHPMKLSACVTILAVSPGSWPSTLLRQAQYWSNNSRRMRECAQVALPARVPNGFNILPRSDASESRPWRQTSQLMHFALFCNLGEQLWVDGEAAPSLFDFG